MEKKRSLILSIGAALAALIQPATAMTTDAPATDSKIPDESAKSEAVVAANQVNQLVRVGEDYLGFIVSENADGAVIAQHYSHSSHASHQSHQSHQSHYSSRY